jgi:hypothetical protein
MEAACSSETSTDFQQTARDYVQIIELCVYSVVQTALILAADIYFIDSKWRELDFLNEMPRTEHGKD